MNRKDLYRAIGETEESLLQESQKKAFPRKPVWAGALAALLVLTVLSVGILRGGRGMPLGTTAAAAQVLREAEYPQMVAHPSAEPVDMTQEEYDEWMEQFNSWQDSLSQQREQGQVDTQSLTPFFTASLSTYLGNAQGENRTISPLNLYMALAMVAEMTQGETQQQILDLLGAESLEALETQAHGLWNGAYRDDGVATTVLASSLWLDSRVSYREELLDRLADTLYASTFQGTMGSESLNQLAGDWLNQQTGGILEDQAKSLSFDPEMVLGLITTLRYQAKWADPFSPESTSPETFHGVQKDVTVDFMYKSSPDRYYWGEQFGAVCLGMNNRGDLMWLLLPDEGVTPEQLAQDPEVTQLLLTQNAWAEWKQNREVIVHLSMPKFDIESQIDLLPGLAEMGITQVMKPETADFSPLLEGDSMRACLSSAKHGVRVMVDEEGVTAAAFTSIQMSGAGAPPDLEMDFVLDRPFLFALTNHEGLPLFVGCVNQLE